MTGGNLQIRPPNIYKLIMTNTDGFLFHGVSPKRDVDGVGEKSEIPLFGRPRGEPLDVFLHGVGDRRDRGRGVSVVVQRFHDLLDLRVGHPGGIELQDGLAYVLRGSPPSFEKAGLEFRLPVPGDLHFYDAIGCVEHPLVIAVPGIAQLLRGALGAPLVSEESGQLVPDYFVHAPLDFLPQGLFEHLVQVYFLAGRASIC